MMKYRMKPVVIDAFQWLPLSSDAAAKDIPYWLVMTNYSVGPDNSLLIKSREGTMRANPGDWIIQSVKGEVYPCKPDMFAATYETVDTGGV